MNYNKNCAREIPEVKVPQLALPSTGLRLRLKFLNCRYTIYNLLYLRIHIVANNLLFIRDDFEYGSDQN